MTFKRTITHWTGGGGRASATDKEHYHTITEFDGLIVNGKHDEEDNIVTSDGDYAAHTRNLNTESIGKAMAGMMGAIEYPLSYGTAPINRVQFEAHCKDLAETHLAYGIPVTGTTCLTHAEVEPTLGVKQANKWDLTVLPFEPSIRGAIPVGDYMRSRVRSYMGRARSPVENYPILKIGARGRFVEDLQSQLSTAGFFSGRRDGDFGSRTKEAVISFQSENGLIIDGIVGPSTWTELMRAEARPQRDVSLSDLRQSGSTTIRAADNGQRAVVIGGGATAALTTIDAISNAGASLSGAEATLEKAQSLLMAYWPLLAVATVGFIVWMVLEKIKSARLSDARTGRNMGR